MISHAAANTPYSDCLPRRLSDAFCLSSVCCPIDWLLCVKAFELRRDFQLSTNSILQEMRRSTERVLRRVDDAFQEQAAQLLSTMLALTATEVPRMFLLIPVQPHTGVVETMLHPLSTSVNHILYKHHRLFFICQSPNSRIMCTQSSLKGYAIKVNLTSPAILTC